MRERRRELAPVPTDASGPLVDLEAERAVCGAVLLAGEDAPAVYERARRHLRCARARTPAGRWSYDGDFADPRHSVIFACMGAVLARGEGLDIITLASELRRAAGAEAGDDDGGGREGGLLNTVGGTQYLGELYDTLPTWAHVESHARLVADLAAARRLLAAFEGGASRLRALGAGAVAEALRGVAEARVERRGKAARSMEAVAVSAWKQLEDALDGRRRPVPTGFAGLDGDAHGVGLFAGGLHRRELVVVVADQAGGKTSWALQVATHAATAAGRSVLVVSQEMSGEQLHWRMACAAANVDGQKVRAGLLPADDLNALQRESERLAGLDLRVVDAGCTAEEVRGAALASHAQRPVDLVVVDYLQILDAPEGAGAKDEHEVIDANAKAMKRLAEQLDCPVVLLSQFNRTGQNAQREPRMQDLKGSGAIESHADTILALYSTATRAGGAPPPEYPVKLIVMKQRSGPTGEVHLVFERAFTRFREDVQRREGAAPPSAYDDMPEAPYGGSYGDAE